MRKTIALVLVSLMACLPLAAQTLEDVAFADVIVVGRVSANSEAVRLPTREKPDGPDTGLRTFGVYEVDVSQTIKGTVSGKIKVVAYRGDEKGLGHLAAKTPEEIEATGHEWGGFCLPRGARMMLFLQTADKNGAVRFFRQPEASDDYYGESDYMKLPEGVRYAVKDFVFGAWQYVYLIPDSAPEKFPLKHDYPARDMMRVWVRATEGLPVDEPRGLMEGHGLERLKLWPDAETLELCKNDWYVIRARQVFGPDPLKFYREEILPNLPPIGPKTTELEIILRHEIAGTYGDPDAARQIAACVFALDTSKSPKLRERVAGIVSSLGQLPNATEAVVSLYTHPDALIVQNAVANPFRPGEGKRYAKAVVALLDHPYDGVKLWALRSLSDIYGERDKDWDMDKIGSRSYLSEALIQYWKEKVGK